MYKKGGVSMHVSRFITGAILGGTIGAVGTMYAFTSERERKIMMRQSRRMMNRTVNKINDLM